MKHIVTLEAPHASGGRKPWFKLVTGMKEDDGQSARHHCFLGRFLDGNRELELEEGTLIVGVYPAGSVAKPGNIAKLLRITAEGQVECLAGNLPESLYDWQKDFHSFCGIVKRELANVKGFKAAAERSPGSAKEIAADCLRTAADALDAAAKALDHAADVAADNNQPETEKRYRELAKDQRKASDAARRDAAFTL